MAKSGLLVVFLSIIVLATILAIASIAQECPSCSNEDWSSSAPRLSWRGNHL